MMSILDSMTFLNLTPSVECGIDSMLIQCLTRRDREVVDFTRSRVKNNTELTNLGN